VRPRAAAQPPHAVLGVGAPTPPANARGGAGGAIFGRKPSGPAGGPTATAIGGAAAFGGTAAATALPASRRDLRSGARTTAALTAHPASIGPSAFYMLATGTRARLGKHGRSWSTVGFEDGTTSGASTWSSVRVIRRQSGASQILQKLRHLEDFRS